MTIEQNASVWGKTILITGGMVGPRADPSTQGGLELFFRS